MDQLPVHLLKLITANLNDNESWASSAYVCKDLHEACLATYDKHQKKYKRRYKRTGKYLRDKLNDLFPDEVNEPIDMIKRVNNHTIDKKFERDEFRMHRSYMYIATHNTESSKVVKDIIIPLIKEMFPTARISAHSKVKDGQTHRLVNVVYMCAKIKRDIYSVLQDFHFKQVIYDESETYSEYYDTYSEMYDFIKKKNDEWYFDDSFSQCFWEDSDPLDTIDRVWNDIEVCMPIWTVIEFSCCIHKYS